MSAQIAPSAVVEPGATVGDRSAVWDLSQVRAGAAIGSDCIVGRNVFIDAGVRLGDRCKVQNNALLYAPASLADGVFIGPAVVLTNDRYPRAVAPDGAVKGASDWQPEGVMIGEGASVGAGAVVLAGVTIGAWALVAAGATVVGTVPPFALVAGSPAKRIRWVGRAGLPLVDEGGGTWRCPATGVRYVEESSERLQEQHE